jgi:hypothetical protein
MPVRELFEVLKGHKNLVHLRLRGNQIGPEGAKWVAEALKTNRTLRELDLRGTLSRIGSFLFFFFFFSATLQQTRSRTMAQSKLQKRLK